jgi:phenylalanyl-tRNA synthetase beta chain
MKISYNWLKWYVPEIPEAQKLADLITYHLAEVESLEKNADGDVIFDIKILPNRAHDLLSHQGVAREIASLLNIKFIDATPKYKIPSSKPTQFKVEIKTPKCRRHVGRVVRNVKVGPSPQWVVQHLEAIGQRSINNIVDATNIVMWDCGQPTHVFDIDKIRGGKLVIREAEEGEKIVLLDGKEKVFKKGMTVIADGEGNPLDAAGIKGGKFAELDEHTVNIILESDNFEPVSTRKTAQTLNIITDAKKRYENDLSPELASYAMRELSALIFEMCPEAVFEDIVDTYPQKQEERKLSFSADRISKILGLKVGDKEIEDILNRYIFKYVLKKGVFEIAVPPMRLDLVIEEDMAEEIVRVIGYDKLKGNIPKIDFKPTQNETYAKISWARNKLLNEGYSEVMTYTFCDKGEVEVMQSASDKKFLRTNLSDGLKESIKLNQLNAPFLGIDKIKVFEIGTIFKKDKEQINVCYGDKKNVIEISLNDFCKDVHSDFSLSTFNFQPSTGRFTPWSLFPFIARDIAVFVPENVKSEEVLEIIKENAGDMVIRGPELFDEFKKDGKISYAFRIVFQSYEKTLTDAEVNTIMDKITEKIKAKGWQVR